MSRLPLADPQDLPLFLKSMHDSADDWSTRHCARAFAARPDILERYLAFYYPFHASDAGSVLDSRIKELVRLRIATLNGLQDLQGGPARAERRERTGGRGRSRRSDRGDVFAAGTSGARGRRENGARPSRLRRHGDAVAQASLLAGRDAGAAHDDRPVHRLRPHARDAPARRDAVPDRAGGRRSTPDRRVSQVIVHHPAEVEVEIDDGEEAAENAHGRQLMP